MPRITLSFSEANWSRIIAALERKADRDEGESAEDFFRRWLGRSVLASKVYAYEKDTAAPEMDDHLIDEAP